MSISHRPSVVAGQTAHDFFRKWTSLVVGVLIWLPTTFVQKAKFILRSKLRELVHTLEVQTESPHCIKHEGTLRLILKSNSHIWAGFLWGSGRVQLPGGVWAAAEPWQQQPVFCGALGVHLGMLFTCSVSDLFLSCRCSTGATFSGSESPSKTDKGRTEGSHRMCKECGTAPVPASRVEPIPEMCEVDNRQLLNASDLEETTSAFLNPCQKVVKGLAVPTEEGEKQDVASSFDEPDSEKFGEANNTRPLRNREIGENGVKSRNRKTLEVSLPSYDRWVNIKSHVDLQSTLIQNNITSKKADNGNKSWEDRSDIESGQKTRETPVSCKSESDSCVNNLIVNREERWKPLSDLEWLAIFKPKKRDGNTCPGKNYSSFATAQEMKCTCSKRLWVCCL